MIVASINQKLLRNESFFEPVHTILSDNNLEKKKKAKAILSDSCRSSEGDSLFSSIWGAGIFKE
jgi:hypothetical protein